MKPRLTPISSGVVHSSPYRTRLKVPASYEFSPAPVRDALLVVPGVTEVRFVGLANIVLEHEGRPEIVESIGEAILSADPSLLEALTAEPAKRELKLPMVVTKFFANGHEKLATDLPEPKIRHWVPKVFVALGLLKLLEGESLLAGVGPIAFFYWAFDSNWKFSHDPATADDVTTTN